MRAGWEPEGLGTGAHGGAALSRGPRRREGSSWAGTQMPVRTTGWMTLPSRTYIKQEEGREDTSVVLCLLNPGYIREKIEIKQLDIMF